MDKIKIAITTGDLDGIGFEVAAKAINLIGPQKNVQFILWRGHRATPKFIKLLDQKFKRVTVKNIDEAIKINNQGLIDIRSDLSPAQWVELTAKLCFKKRIHAIATGPLSKTAIKKSGMKDLGHTDILKRISKTKSVHMGFVGSEFSVLLATGHLPISELSKNMNTQTLVKALVHADELKKCLSKNRRKLPIGILGLNPHSGEEGLIGSEEQRFFAKVHSFAKAHSIPIEGPLVPDAAFLKSNWNKYSVYLALYHDQGLIPFKLVHGQHGGVHISVGIPFVRTSVDHGTAKDIFGKNIANPNSMKEAIELAIKLARQP